MKEKEKTQPTRGEAVTALLANCYTLNTLRTSYSDMLTEINKFSVGF